MRDKLRFRDQRQDGETGAHIGRVEVDGPDRPCGFQHFQDARADRRGARVARFQLVQAARQLGREARFVDPEMLRDAGEIVVGLIQKLGQIVFDFNVVVGAGDTKPGGASSAERDSWFNLPISDFRFRPILPPIKSAGWCLPDPWKVVLISATKPSRVLEARPRRRLRSAAPRHAS